MLVKMICARYKSVHTLQYWVVLYCPLNKTANLSEVVTQAYDPSSEEAEVRDYKFSANLGYMWIILSWYTQGDLNSNNETNKQTHKILHTKTKKNEPTT